jgi:hypothetical protein
VPDTGPAAALEEIRGLVSKRDEALAWAARASADDGELDAAAGAFEAAQDKLAERAPRLAAALEAVLEQAGKWEQEGRRLAALAADETDPQSRIAVSLRAQAFEDLAKVREAITRELTGEGGWPEALTVAAFRAKRPEAGRGTDR